MESANDLLLHTVDFDDTLPVELLDCVDTTTNADWLTRDTSIIGKVASATKDRNIRTQSSVFNPPPSSTRYQSDGSSSEFSSDSAIMAESGLSADDSEELISAASQKNPLQSVHPVASMEFQPLRCSTAVTNDLAAAPAPQPAQQFEIRVDTCEFKSLQRTETESSEFNPPRCSTGISDIRPISEEFYTCAEENNVPEDESNFVTALGFTQANSGCAGVATSPSAQVTPSPDPKSAEVGEDLSIMMLDHLNIRDGRLIESNVQAKPQIEFSVSKKTPAVGLASSVPEASQSKATSIDGKSKIPSRPTNQQNSHQQPSTSTGANSKVMVRGESRTKSSRQFGANFVVPSATGTLPKTRLPGPSDLQKSKSSRSNSPCSSDGRKSPSANLPKSRLPGPSDLQKSKSSRSNSPCSSDGRKSPMKENRVQRAIDYLATANIQRVVPALATLDSARSAPLCESLVESNLINNIYDFLAKMNRSLVHQTACGHATSLLLDLSKYSFSAESTWQNGDRVGLLFNLMSIWVSKDNGIFLNCATILWVFCQDETRAKVLKNFVTAQPKLLEKISVKLSTKILRPATEVPSLDPSWMKPKLLRTFNTPCSAFAGLNNAIKKMTPRG